MAGQSRPPYMCSMASVFSCPSLPTLGQYHQHVQQHEDGGDYAAISGPYLEMAQKQEETVARTAKESEVSDDKVTLAQAVANETATREENERLKGLLATTQSKIVVLQQEAEALKGQVNAAQSRIPSHAPGLCQEASCEGCMDQAQEIATAAYAKGRGDLSDHIDAALRAAGGEPLRERVAAALAQGQVIVEQRQLEIAV